MSSPTMIDSSIRTPPGTVTLQESDKSGSTGDIILQPQPTRDPNDALNWSKPRRYWNFALTCVYVAVTSVLLNAATPTWGPMDTQLGFSYEILDDSYAAGSGMLGLGSIILIPLSLKFGRCTIYLFRICVQFAESIWSAKITTVGDLTLVNIISCLCGAIYEVIVQMTIAELFFVHERGMLNSIYIWMINVGSTFGALIAGYITTGLGWRAVWWAVTIAFGGNLILSLDVALDGGYGC